VRGKGRFLITQYVPTDEKVTRRFPLLLTTGRVLSQYNVGAQTRRTANTDFYAADLLEIHPHDAEERGIREGDRVEHRVAHRTHRAAGDADRAGPAGRGLHHLPFSGIGRQPDHHRKLRLGHQLSRVQGHGGAGVADGRRMKPLVRPRGLARWRSRPDDLAEETPVAFEYNGISHAVMLATPADLEDFGVGFSLSEGIVARRQDIFDLVIVESEAGITLRIEIAGADFARLKERRRSLAGRTGCGLCGAESLGQVMRELPPLAAAGTVSAGGAACGHAPVAGLASAAAGHRGHPCRLPRRPRRDDQPRPRGCRPPQRPGQDARRAGARGRRAGRWRADRHQPRQLRNGAEGGGLRLCTLAAVSAATARAARLAQTQHEPGRLPAARGCVVYHRNAGLAECGA
jgi:hypothetical protein